MAFEIIVSKKAQAEMENALDYYSEIHRDLATKFYAEITECYQKLALHPYFEIRYKKLQSYKIT